MPQKPRCRITKDHLIDAALVAAVLAIATPGIIWWAITLWELVQ